MWWRLPPWRGGVAGGAELGHIVKTCQKRDSKTREIDWSYLCLQWFDKFWMWSAGNRKRKLCEFAETRMEKLVKSRWANPIFGGFLTLGHNAKTCQKRDQKNSCNRPETEVIWICRNSHGKTREITLGELMFWRVFDIWNHCATAHRRRGTSRLRQQRCASSSSTVEAAHCWLFSTWYYVTLTQANAAHCTILVQPYNTAIIVKPEGSLRTLLLHYCYAYACFTAFIFRKGQILRPPPQPYLRT